MKKVLILSVAQGRGSGAERVLEYLLGSGKELLTQRLMIVSPKGSALACAAKDLSYEWIPWEASEDSFFSNFRAFLKLVGMPEMRTIGVFHAWAARSFEWAAGLSLFHGAVVLGTLHDSPRAFFHGHIRRWMMRSCARLMRSYVCVSHALLDECVKCKFRGSGRVIHNGLPDLPQNPVHTNPLVQIGFLGTQFAWKGIEIVAEVIEKTAHLPVHWHLFGGTSPETEGFVREICRRAADRVTCHGFEPASAVYQSLDMVFHPSIEFDPLPTVLIESARAGIPVVASRMGGADEIIAHGETGLLYEVRQIDEAIRLITKLVNDAELRRRLGGRGRVRFEREFRVENMLKGYSELWQESLDAQQNSNRRSIRKLSIPGS